MFTYPLDQIPFSLCGSFLTITSRNSSGSPRLIYKTSSGRIHYTHNLPFPAEEFFELALIKAGYEIPYTWQAYPHKLELTGEAGERVTLVFSDPNTLLFQAQNVGLKLLPCKTFPVQYSPAANQVCLVDWYARGIHMFRADDNSTIQAARTQIVTGIEKHWGEFPCTITFEPKADSETIHGQIRFARYEITWEKPVPEFTAILRSQENTFSSWMDKLTAVPKEYQHAAEIAWFTLWSCRVPPEGSLARPAIYMSKFWMNGIWAWDNLFNAIAICKADPQLAWDQLRLFFDLQDPNGMIPDMITDQEPIFGFTKPPLQGWAITKLIDRLGIKQTLPYLEEIYAPLCRLTDWWYNLRDFDLDGLPQYAHGNDSGWDNATVFDHGDPVEGADLSSYLVLQCECLANMAKALGKEKEALRWNTRAHKQLKVLLSHSVMNDHFISPLSGNHRVEDSLSLINYMPLVLGKRLPKRIRSALIPDLQPGGPYLTPIGLASESPKSIKYMPDGYWRGPVWAASTYLIVDGLIDCGENQLAHLIAERFCKMCLKHPGFWENYDALSGEGLRCPGYSWTASIFLLLAEWLESKNNKE